MLASGILLTGRFRPFVSLGGSQILFFRAREARDSITKKREERQKFKEKQAEEVHSIQIHLLAFLAAPHIHNKLISFYVRTP